MAKLTLADVSNILGNPTSAANTINANSALIETALENTLSRDGSTPNQMNSDLDMNSNDVLNVGTLDVTTLVVDGEAVQPGSLVNALLISNNLSELTPTSSTARGNISAAKSGANSDITSLSTTTTISGLLTVNGFTPITSAHVPNPSTNVQGTTGVPGIDGGHWMIWNSPVSWDDKITLRIDRHISDGSGGIAANTYSALWALGTSPVVGEGYEWLAKFELHNRTANTSGAQNLAMNATAFLEDETIQVGKTWGANLVVHDLQGSVNPTQGRVGVEVDNYCAADGSTDNNRARCGIQLAFGTGDNTVPSPGTPLHFGRGFLVGSNNANIICDRLFEISGNGSFDIGFDSSAATFTKPVYFMGQGQRIAFDGNSSGAYNRSLRYDSGQWAYETQNGDVFKVDDNGNTDSSGEYRVDGVKVVGNRATGWSAATGTATRTTFATGSVTLPQLAERVKAVIDDLITHGLIGA